MKQGFRHFFGCVLAWVTACAVFAIPLLMGISIPSVTDDAPVQTEPPLTVVLDAGHGGEDAGASSASGIKEKDINLAIAEFLRDLLEANGVSVVMTRTTDVLLYDKTVDYHGRKKQLDLAARRKIAESTENCVFVSIHMNAYPQPQYHGLQVWYSQNHEASRVLAETIQGMTRQYLQAENQRKMKPATSSIYLLHHLQMPAVLIECGFLSNPNEAELLAEEDYQKQLAFLIFLSLTDGMQKIADNS